MNFRGRGVLGNGGGSLGFTGATPLAKPEAEHAWTVPAAPPSFLSLLLRPRRPHPALAGHPKGRI